MEQKKARRNFTPEQKFEFLKDIERCGSIKEGLAKHGLHYSGFRSWQRQLEVGVRASLRNGPPAHVHPVNNKSAVLQELNELKSKTRERRKAYWVKRFQELRVESRSLILGLIRKKLLTDDSQIFKKASDGDPGY